MGIRDKRILRDALEQDEKNISLLMRDVLSSQESKKMVLSLDPCKAEKFMAVLQFVSPDYGRACEQEAHRLNRCWIDPLCGFVAIKIRCVLLNVCS